MIKIGIKPGDIITIHSPNCMECPIIYLPVQEIGAVPSPVNPLYTTGSGSVRNNGFSHCLFISIPKLYKLVIFMLFIVNVQGTNITLAVTLQAFVAEYLYQPLHF